MEKDFTSYIESSEGKKTILHMCGFSLPLSVNRFKNQRWVFPNKFLKLLTSFGSINNLQKPEFLFLLSGLAYVIKTIASIDNNEFLLAANYLWDMLTDNLLTFCEAEQYFIKMCFNHVLMLDNDKSLFCYHNKTLVKNISAIRRRYGQAVNDFVTSLYKGEGVVVDFDILPDYFFRVATVKWFTFLCTRLNLFHLALLNLIMGDISFRYSYVNKCHDILYMTSNLHQILKAKSYIKLVQFNSRACTCNAKCTNNIGKQKFELEFMEGSFLNQTSLILCSQCLNASKISKMRRTFVSLDPIKTICSIDGCSHFELWPLINMSVMFKENTFYTNYSHMFHIQNAIALQDILTGMIPTSRKIVLTGICFGANRKCLRMISRTILLAKQDINRGISNVSEIKKLCKCSSCDAHKEYFVQEKYTCLGKYLFGKEENYKFMLEMCRGCKLAVMCNHIDQYICKRLHENHHSVKYFQVFKRLITVRNLLLEDITPWKYGSYFEHT